MSKPPPDVDAGWDLIEEQPEHEERRRTPWPSFDLAAFARDSETSLAVDADARAEANKVPTAPPPPFHPASIRPPSSRVREASEALVPSLRRRIVECTERTQLVRTQLRIGGLTREEAARALATDLGGLEMEAARTGSSIAQLTVALRTAIEELGGIAGDAPGVQFEVIVLDEQPETRTRVVLAVESLGHVARAATSLTELAILAAQRMPDAVFVAAAATGAHDARQPEVCTLLREVVRSEHVAVILYAEMGGARLEEVARAAGANRWFRSDDEIEVMMHELGTLFGELLL